MCNSICSQTLEQEAFDRSLGACIWKQHATKAFCSSFQKEGKKGKFHMASVDLESKTAWDYALYFSTHLVFFSFFSFTQRKI
ncbi:hypothetical protein XENTR_v10001633 [Xenopus tropicalis]|nr:hypothetical protein XENTR_v10001633 [Xenopus tropicalis]